MEKASDGSFLVSGEKTDDHEDEDDDENESESDIRLNEYHGLPWIIQKTANARIRILFGQREMIKQSEREK
jgi:hypothetical protein